MLLRSSSTPVIGTLLPSFSDSPKRDLDTFHNYSSHIQNPTLFDDHSVGKLPFPHGGYHRNLTSNSRNSSLVSHPASRISVFNQESRGLGFESFRRAQSVDNLESLTYHSRYMEESDDLSTPKMISSSEHCEQMLHTEPSFSIYNSDEEYKNDDNDPQEVFKRTITIGESIEALGSDEFSFGKKRMCLVEEEGENGEEDHIGIQNDPQEVLKRTITIGDSIEALGNSELSFEKNSMSLIEEEGDDEEGGLTGIQNLSFEEPASPPMYLAAGLGIDAAGSGGAPGFNNGNHIDLSRENFDGKGDAEEYYERMLDEYPCHPLLLRNYAQLLQSKGELHRAEEYYFRATLADPDDGEIMSRYAKLVWELHHDKDRALSYFEQASQAAPKDSHVLAAYASFLWEIEDDEEDETQRTNNKNVEEYHKSKPIIVSEDDIKVVSPLDFAVGNGTDGNLPVAYSGSGNIEDYYKKLIGEHPTHALFLRNYARFLIQSRGDLQKAEEYYSRAILTDPRDGKIMSEYAKLMWELYHDKEKALVYFEQAVQATPGDSHVLAAYASFLWETEDGDAEILSQSNVREPLLTTANA
ncbi:Tetratricopeptide repeat (TPR)-like superfamily protein [Quillaja saponaria]|uniref:Tetratricopeptide repeat (TPR)-like superfamily protein n=1 Tax=Quillaja saponaria TaxID=32244 RepID=A0AAD7LCB2_QUISA|nr:Tetratricopeptide repeat (TPR)-like superfamily protein [Quillaja saponaria]